MTNVKSSNIKLKERSLRILMAETGLEETTASQLMVDAQDDLRVALVMSATGVVQQIATSALSDNDFVVEKAIASLN